MLNKDLHGAQVIIQSPKSKIKSGTGVTTQVNQLTAFATYQQPVSPNETLDIQESRPDAVSILDVETNKVDYFSTDFGGGKIS